VLLNLSGDGGAGGQLVSRLAAHEVGQQGAGEVDDMDAVKGGARAEVKQVEAGHTALA